jgi:hypothetical protein
MADPVTTFGLAAGVLQFVDCASRFANKAWRVYRSGPEGLSNLADMKLIGDNLQHILESLQQPLPNTDDDMKSQSSIARLANECRKSAAELVNSIKKIMPPERPRKKEALVATLKVI